MTDNDTVYLHGATFEAPRETAPRWVFWVVYGTGLGLTGALYWWLVHVL